MQWGGPGFVIAIIALSYGGWILSTWIRSRHGYPIENEWGGMVSRGDLGADRKIELLTNENGALKDQVARLEERVAVVERIVTDKSLRLDAEIEKLR